MNTTPNLGLKKPLQTEFYNVDDFNYNSDTIDQAIHDLSENKQNKLSTSQMDAVNSGMTTAKRQKLDSLPTSTQLDDSLSSKANKSDITNISITGTTNNTGSTILAGTLFYFNGTLCKTLVDVADGATFTNGTNYQATIRKNSKLQIVKTFPFTSSTEYKRVGSITIPAFYSFGLTAQSSYGSAIPNGVFFSDSPTLNDYSRNAEGKCFSNFEGLFSEPITLYVYCKEASAGVNTNCRIYGWIEPLY